MTKKINKKNGAISGVNIKHRASAKGCSLSGNEEESGNLRDNAEAHSNVSQLTETDRAHTSTITDSV